MAKEDEKPGNRPAKWYYDSAENLAGGSKRPSKTRIAKARKRADFHPPDPAETGMRELIRARALVWDTELKKWIPNPNII
jgi:hypothetical protein